MKTAPLFARLVIASAVAVSGLLGLASSASASGCPVAGVDQLGGKHTCYDAGGSHGHVHFWKPPGYDPKTAITVIYIHGYDLPGKNLPDSCKGKKPYVDCAWDASDFNIVGQFAASTSNALYVAIQGKVDNKDPLKWTKLDDLLKSLGTQLKEPPPQDVTIMAHSGGMYTATHLWEDSRVKHVASFDWVDASLKGATESWYKQGGGRKLTLVGGNGGQEPIMTAMRKDLAPCRHAKDATSLDADDLNAACLHMSTGVTHMQTISKQKYIPQVVKRSKAPPVSGGGNAEAVPSAPAIGPTTGTISPGMLVTPVLEIPIPGVNFSGAVRENGMLTLPFLAQYVSGVYTFLISIVGLVAATMIIIGGFQYLTSGGDKSKTADGKKRIFNALLGLTLAFGSWILLYTINPDLVQFKGLQLTDVKLDESLIHEDADPGNDPDSATVSAAAPPDLSGVSFGAGAVAFCTRNAGDCPEWCRRLSTDVNQWPETSKGSMAKSQTVEIPNDTYKGRLVLNGNGQRAHPKVAAALKATAEKMTDDYPDRKLLITASECWRSVRSQIGKVCIAGQGVKPGVDYGSAVANPGGSNHGVGYACDLHLSDGGDSLGLYYSTKTECKSNVTSLKLFDKIMFDSGWVRYDREIWHYEFGTPASVPSRCGPGRGACSYPPAHYASYCK